MEGVFKSSIFIVGLKSDQARRSWGI